MDRGLINKNEHEDAPGVTATTAGFSGLAERYAMALFDLAEQDKVLDSVADELTGLNNMIDSSADMRRLIRSPVISRQDQSKAMDAILAKASVGDLTRKFVGFVVTKRRLFALPDMIKAFLSVIAARRGETTAEVVSAKPLTKAQLTSLGSAMKSVVGTDVALTSRVEPEILGGLIVKVGSRMVDSSLRTKLNRLSLAIKGIG